jgi:Protein of unknown function (DUF3485)
MTEKPHRRRMISRVLSARIVALLLLGGIFAERLVFSGDGPDVAAYHDRVRAAADSFPYHVAGWLGRNSQVPQGAITLLKPNVIVSRTFSDMNSEAGFSFLLVHCRDARDMLGHFPPVCYAGQGWSLKSASAQDWENGKIQGMRYVFEVDRAGYSSSIVVDNFMLLPSGRTARSMDHVEATARDSRLKHYGAAQVQFVYDGDLTETEHDAISSAFIDELLPIISIITEPLQEARK